MSSARSVVRLLCRVFNAVTSRWLAVERPPENCYYIICASRFPVRRSGASTCDDMCFGAGLLGASLSKSQVPWTLAVHYWRLEVGEGNSQLDIVKPPGLDTLKPPGLDTLKPPGLDTLKPAGLDNASIVGAEAVLV